MRNFGHEKLSVFGVGKGLAEAEWRSLFRQLVARGLVDIDLEGYGGLRLSDSCRPLLRGEVTCNCAVTSNRRSLPKARGPVAAARQPTGAGRIGRHCAPCGASWPKNTAPPYVIFPDSTLLEMLRSQPVSLSDMAQVSGGRAQAGTYGQAFLEVLNDNGGTREAPKVVLDLRHELVSLARAA